MNYRDWQDAVPEAIRADSVWKLEVYRLSLFAADLAWHDATKLVKDGRTTSLADQLYRSVGAISADVEEGYSRGTGRDRARFYEYGLGSAREARGWYFKGRHVLGQVVGNHRSQFLTHIIRLLLTMIPDQRARVLQEEAPVYHVAAPGSVPEHGPLTGLLENVPQP